jgi:hypothetical protein
MTIQHVFKTTDFLWELCTRSLAENVRSSLVDQSGCLTMTIQCMCNGVDVDLVNTNLDLFPSQRCSANSAWLFSPGPGERKALAKFKVHQ